MKASSAPSRPPGGSSGCSLPRPGSAEINRSVVAKSKSRRRCIYDHPYRLEAALRLRPGNPFTGLTGLLRGTDFYPESFVAATGTRPLH
jgi:hypothetical protein